MAIDHPGAVAVVTAAGHPSPTRGIHLKGWWSNDDRKAGRAAAQSAFLLGTLRKNSRMGGRRAWQRPDRSFASLGRRQSPAETCDRVDPRGPGSSLEPSHRHRAGVRYGGRRDGAVVAARRPRRRPAGVGELWRGLGQGCGKQLKLTDAALLKAPYGQLPDLAAVDFSHDVVFTWNGTTSGVRVPDASWIAADRQGLTICDATSAAFAQRLDFGKLDVVTFSWQKALGGEAAHGMLVLSPRAIERLESHRPPWPLPKIFRLTKGGKLDRRHVRGRDHQHALHAVRRGLHPRLEWASALGGLDGAVARADANAARLHDWVDRCPLGRASRRRSETRSNTSVCLAVTDPAGAAWPRHRSAFVNFAAAHKEGVRLRHRRPPRCAAGPAHLVRRHRRDRRHRSAAAMARLGPCTVTRDRPCLRDGQQRMPPVSDLRRAEPAAVQIFRDRGIAVDYEHRPADKEALRAIIGDYDGLAIRSTTKVTAKLMQPRRPAQGDRPRRHRRRQCRSRGGHRSAASSS